MSNPTASSSVNSSNPSNPSNPAMPVVPERVVRGLIRQIAPILWGGLALNLLALCLPVFTMLVYDKVIGNDVHETLWAMVLGMVGVMGVELVLRMARAYVLEHSAAQWDSALDQRIQSGIFGHALDRNLSLGALFGNLREVSSRRDLLTATALLPLMDMPFLLIYLGGVALLGGVMVCVPVLIGAGVVALQVAIHTVVKPLTVRAANYQKERIDLLHGLAVCRSTLAGSIRAQEFSKRVSNHSLLTARAGARLQFWLQMVASIVPAASSATTVLVMVVGVYMVEAQWMSAGQLIAASLLATRAVGAMLSIHPTWARFKELDAALKELGQMLQLYGPSSVQRDYRAMGAAPQMQCDAVNYRYPQADRNAVQELSFALEAGQVLAVVGKVGCGKTSLLRLLAGHFVPGEGSIAVGNLTIRNAQDAQRLRHCVAYAEQFAVLLEGTVENFLLAEHSTELEKDRALQWLRALKLDLALRDCGLAMNTVIGPGGSNLSGGQRRVLAVVRAIGMQRPVLVLDEPTAGLDAEVEKMVVDAIGALRGIVTVVVATHTAALMGVADRVLVLEGGRHAGWVIPQTKGEASTQNM